MSQQLDRVQKLMSLGADPPADLEYLINDLRGEMQRRGVPGNAFKGVEISLRTAFALGERNAALRIMRENDGPEPT